MIECGDALFGRAMAVSRLREAEEAKKLADAEYAAAGEALRVANEKRDQYLKEQAHRDGP